MEYLIGQENIDGMKKLADRGWFGEQELNGFLTKAGELEKWDAFRVLLAWKNHISVKEKSTATETKQELIAGLMKHCKNELCWRYPELGRALLELRVQPDEQVTAMETDGESLYVNSEYLIQLFGENPEKVLKCRNVLERRQRNRKQSAKNGRKSQKNLRLPTAQAENEEARTAVVRVKNFLKSRRENMTTGGFYVVLPLQERR